MSSDDPTAEEFLDAFKAQLSTEEEGPRPGPPIVQPDTSGGDHQPEPADIDYLLAGNRKQQALVDLFHPRPEPETPTDEGAPDFDGGARQPAPLPTDPEHDHNDLIAEFYWGSKR
jgi:hypothetical protein